MMLRSDSYLELMHNADIVTIVNTVMEVQIFAKRSFQEEMMPDVEIDIAIAAVDSTVVFVHELAAAKHKNVERAMKFLEAHGNLLDSLAAPEEPIESSLYRDSVAAGRVKDW